MSVEPTDLMDTAEVAEHLGVSVGTVQNAVASPHRNPRVARLLPPPLRKVGRSWVWRRTDIEAIEP